MVEKHPQRYPPNLINKLKLAPRSARQDFHIPQLRTNALYLICIIQLKQPLFYKLHARHGCRQLRERCDPEHSIDGHGLLGCYPLGAGAMLEDRLAVISERREDQAGNLSVGAPGGVFRDDVTELCLEAW